MDRRREQNRQAQRRYRQRQGRLVQKAIHVHYLAPGANPDSPSPSSSTLPHAATSAIKETPAAPATPGARLTSGPDLLFPPAATSPSAPKSFCDIIADGVNLLLDGIGTIDMDGIQIPNPYPAPQTSSLLARREMPNTQHPSSTSLQTYQLPVPPRAASMAEATTTRENTTQELPSAASRGWLNPLHMAARKGRDKIVQSLLQHNANCNLGDSDGLTPLMHATIGGFGDIIAMLLSHGASIEQVDARGRSALHWAVVEKQGTLLKVLLEKGAENPPFTIDRYDESGRTPLHLAVDEDFETGVQLLLKFGADVHSHGRPI